MSPLSFCCATGMFLHVGLLHRYAEDKSFGCAGITSSWKMPPTFYSSQSDFMFFNF